MGALCLSTAVLRHAPPHVRAPAPRKKPLSAPRGSTLRQKTRHCPKPLTFSEMDIIIIKHTKSACLAQPVEHAAVNRSVGGSSPSTGAIVAARRTSQQLSVPRRVVCMYACGSSSRRKNARRSLCSSFLRNYRAALSFLLRAAASPRFLFFIVSSSNPLTLFSPCTTPRADQLAKTCYSVAPCAPYGGRVRWQAPSSPQGDSRRTSRISARFLHPLLR